MTIHGSMSGATRAIEEVLEEAREYGKFMSVVWFVDDKGTLHCKKTTWQFPTARFSEARELLGKIIDEEQNPVKRPLPLASFLQRRPAELTEQVMNAMGVSPEVFSGTERPVEKDESINGNEMESFSSPVAGAPEDNMPDPEDGE